MKKQIKILAGIGLLGGLGTAIYLYFKKKKEADELKSAKNNKISFTATALTGFYGLLYGLKELNIGIPATKDKFFELDQVAAVKAKLQVIKKTYDREIKQAELLSNLPYEMIAGLIFIESGGDKNVVSSAGAIGLCQITPDTANAAIVKEQLSGRLTEAEKVILAKYLPELTSVVRQKKTQKVSRLQAILWQPNLGGPTLIKAADLKKPELNILLGAMWFKFLIDLTTVANKPRLESAIVKYNGGLNRTVPGANLAETLAKITSTETKAYILKMIGTNGVLQMQMS